jgi:Protein of unknown function (DUF3455)
MTAMTAMTASRLTRCPPSPRRAALPLIALGLGLEMANAGCSSREAVTAPEVPTALAVPAGNKPVLRFAAEGAQIYTCQPDASAPGAFAWTLKAPDATLFNAAHEKAGTHYAGPTWESADGSRLVGTVKAKENSPTPDAIPWLLLEKKSSEGQGTLARVTFVQRVHTTGGKAPAGGCGAGSLGKEERVDYKADYYFYAP